MIACASVRSTRSATSRNSVPHGICNSSGCAQRSGSHEKVAIDLDETNGEGFLLTSALGGVGGPILLNRAGAVVWWYPMEDLMFYP